MKNKIEMNRWIYWIVIILNALTAGLNFATLFSDGASVNVVVMLSNIAVVAAYLFTFTPAKTKKALK